jgi:predicted nucleic acid-binding protein
MMIRRVFIDTNILLDVLVDRPAFAAESEAVLLLCEKVGAQVFISWHGLATAYYLLKKGRTQQQTLIELDRIFAWARVAPTSDAALAGPETLVFLTLRTPCSLSRRSLVLRTR